MKTIRIFLTLALLLTFQTNTFGISTEANAAAMRKVTYNIYGDLEEYMVAEGSLLSPHSEPINMYPERLYFSGWCELTSITGSFVRVWNYSYDRVPNHDIVLAPIFLTIWTINYESNGGTSVPKAKVEEKLFYYANKAQNYPYSIPEPEEPTKSGYVFKGWYKDPELKNLWNFDKDYLRVGNSEDWNRTLYAGWEKSAQISSGKLPGLQISDSLNKTNDLPKIISLANEDKAFKVSYDSLGGSSIDSQTIVKGKKIVEPESPERNGYIFAGWFKDAELKDPWDFTADSVTADMILYAKWSQIIVTEVVPQKTIEPEPNAEKETKIQVTLGSTTMWVNQESILMDVAPFIQNNRIMLPLRWVSLGLGIPDSGVLWDEGKRSITIKHREKTAILTIDSKIMLIDGKAIAIDAAPVIVDNRTFLPLRVIGEQLFDAQVIWKDETKTAEIITTND